MTQSTSQPDHLEPNTRSDRYRKKRPLERLHTFGRDLLDGFLWIDAMGLAKQVSYGIVFALVPSIFVLVAAGTLVENYTNVPVTEQLRDYVVENVPEDAQEIMLNAIDQAIVNTSTATASIGGLIALLIALWAGMGGAATLVEAINRAYGVRNTRPWPKKKLFSLAVTLALTAMIVLTVIAAFFGNRTVSRISNSNTLGDNGWLFLSAESLQNVLAVSATFVALLLLYRFAPALDHTWRWSAPGAALITVAWILLLEVSGYVIRRINYDTVFGAAGGFVLLLYVLNFAGILLIAGAVLNGVLGERFDRRRTADLEAHPEKLRYAVSGQEVQPNPFQLPFKIPSF